MAAQGLNAVRVYTIPPGWLLDLALRHGLRVMVGLPWEQHVAFLESEAVAASIEARVRAGVLIVRLPSRRARYSIGNEIPRLDRALVRPRPDRAVPAAALPGGEERGSGRPGHLRQLSLDRIPESSFPRFRLLQRLPRIPGGAGIVYRAPSGPRRRPAAGDGRDRPPQPAQRARGAGGGARMADPHGLSRRAAPARSRSRGPTSGIAAGSRSWTGTSA